MKNKKFSPFSELRKPYLAPVESFEREVKRYELYDGFLFDSEFVKELNDHVSAGHRARLYVDTEYDHYSESTTVVSTLLVYETDPQLYEVAKKKYEEELLQYKVAIKEWRKELKLYNQERDREHFECIKKQYLSLKDKYEKE